MEQLQRPTARLIFAVEIWWMFCTLTTMASKSVMDSLCTSGPAGLTSSFRDMRWVELTALQHLVGAILAVTWLKITRKSIWPASMYEHKKIIFLSVLGNVVGNLATNAAYALLAAPTVQVIKICEPLFASLYLYKTTNIMSSFTSLIIMSISLAIFLREDPTFNIWGLFDALISSAAFPFRHIFFNELKNTWDNPIQKFAVVSVGGVVLLLPIWLVQVTLVSGFPATRLYLSVPSGLAHSVYNYASIAVLESVNPATHAILNVGKRLFIILVNALFFYIPFTIPMIVGVLMLAVAAYLSLVQLRNFSASKVMGLKCFFLTSVLIYSMLGTSFLSQKHLSSGVTSSSLQFENDLRFLKALGGECVRENRISTAWVYDQPIPPTVVTNIEAISALHPNMAMYVYCGTTQCMNAVGKLQNVTVEFAKMATILKGMPLEQWLAHHLFNKIVAGKDYEIHLQDALMLGLLWKYGGFCISPTIKLQQPLTFPSCNNGLSSWVSDRVATGQLFDAAYATQKHPFIHGLAKFYANSYPTEGKLCLPLNFNIREKLAYVLNKSCSICPLIRNDIKLEKIINRHSVGKHYGTLSYDSRVHLTRRPNLGDEIQGFGGIQFLPYLDTFVERDSLRASKQSGNVTVFFNAWWGAASAQWPPPANINPIMVSIHIDGGMAKMWSDHLDYLKEREPIGCRDTSTLDFMNKHNIKAFFSACLTLLLKNPNFAGKRNDKIYIVDLRRDFVAMLPSAVRKKAIYVSHTMYGGASSDIKSRSTLAYKYVKMYSEAKLVITRRIHCALPCVAMGTPVIFFNSAWMPGGGGFASTSRLSGLSSLFHTLDLYKMSKDEVKKWLGNFSWDNPPPNPDISMTMRLRASIWNVIRENPSLYDAGRKFGVVPMSPLPSRKTRKLVFHLVFTTFNSTVIGSFSNGTQWFGTFNWRHWRCIESIFYHHPTSEVIVHSNTLPQNMFDVLSESGYSITVQTYNLKALLRGSPARNFLKHIDEAQKSSKWHVYEMHLLHLLILYREGGIYMNTDMILVRSLHALVMNELELGKNGTTCGPYNFMMFESDRVYLKDVLSHYSSNIHSPGLVTNIEQDLMPYVSFDLFDASTVVADCFSSTDGQDFNRNMHLIKTTAFVVKLHDETSGYIGLKTTMKEGTICSNLLRSFCVLCNNIH